MVMVMTDIKVPPLGESVTEATVGKWHKKAGDTVRPDELIVELETDKISMEVNATTGGILESIKTQEGSIVHVGDILGSIKEGNVMIKTEELKTAIASTETTEEITLSPAAKKIAAEKNISPKDIKPTGRGGEVVTKEDVLSFNPSSQQASKSNTAEIGERITERVKMSKLRQTIAARLKMSQNTAAILTTFNEIDMSKVSNLRNKTKDELLKKYGVKLGFMSFFVKAVTTALKEFPIVNAEIDGDEIIYKKFYDIGVAVGTEKGLVVPILKDANKLSFIEIEKAIGDLAKKARDGKLGMQDLSGGTFSITNGGTYGSLLSTPILNPPQSAILGMHNIVQRPMAIDGRVEIRPMMYVALSYDHRIVDGKDAVSFLVKVKEYVENPELFCMI